MTVHAYGEHRDQFCESSGAGGPAAVLIHGGFWRAQYTLAQSIPPRMDQTAVAPKASATAPPRQTFTVDAGADVFGVEADDFAASVLDGRPPRVTRQDTMGNMQLLDRLRRQIGVVVP